MPTLCKKYRWTSNASLIRIFSELDLYWFFINVSNSLTHSCISGTMMLGSAWLDLSSSHSANELEIKYSVSACFECFLCAYFTSASTHTRWWMLKILVLNGLDSRACYSRVRSCIKSVVLYCISMSLCENWLHIVTYYIINLNT